MNMIDDILLDLGNEEYGNGLQMELVDIESLALAFFMAGGERTKLVSYLLLSRNYKNIVSGNYNTISYEAQVSLRIVKQIMPELKKINFIKQKSEDVYMINPEVIKIMGNKEGEILQRLWEET